MVMPNPDPRMVLQQAFPGIAETEATALVSSGTVRVYAPEVILCREDAIEDTFYIILAGEVRVTKMINNEEVRLLKHLYPGDFFGEMALIHNAPRVATVSSVRQTQVLEIHKNDFEQVLQNSTSMSMAMVREVSRRLRENDDLAINALRSKASELSAAYQKLAEQEFARREFLTTIAHELRNPLTAASGFLHVALAGQLDEKALHNALYTVAANLQHITTLVNDILFLQEVDLIFADFLPTDVPALVEGVFAQQRERAAQSGVELHLEIAPALPKIPADPKTLERALMALVDNAIKFSPQGGSVRAQITQTAEQIKIAITDQGIGIPEDKLPRIFERFFHTDAYQGHLFGGIGIGLSIARQVIEQHGGRIEVSSQLGKGSTFTIYLNLQQQSEI
ncbi:MAG: hypothetical protein OHK0052_04850 [Anaerolineales bacterium]